MIFVIASGLSLRKMKQRNDRLREAEKQEIRNRFLMKFLWWISMNRKRLSARKRYLHQSWLNDNLFLFIFLNCIIMLSFVTSEITPLAIPDFKNVFFCWQLFAICYPCMSHMRVGKHYYVNHHFHNSMNFHNSMYFLPLRALAIGFLHST